MPRFKHVILDRDGVLNQEAPSGFVEAPDQWVWLPGVLDGLSTLAKAGICLSIATNQSCVGRGIISALTLDQIHEKMKQEAAQRGVCFNGIYCCPHHPDFGCRCRKPMPGLLERAIRECGFSPAKTVFIGDAESDLQSGQAAGITTWLVRTGKGMDTEAALKQGLIKNIDPKGVLVFNNLNAACVAILSDKFI
jgi:D-glycero-D-manno-heptose 1,7-bisphosphate phosphatase